MTSYRTLLFTTAVFVAAAAPAGAELLNPIPGPQPQKAAVAAPSSTTLVQKAALQGLSVAPLLLAS